MAGRAIAVRKSAQSCTVLAMGPMTGSENQPLSLRVGYTPGRGTKPYNIAETRGDYAVIHPGLRHPAIGNIREASATAAPPELPPQVFEISYGFRVFPNTSLKVCEPAPHSGVLVFPQCYAARLDNSLYNQSIFVRDIVGENSRAIGRSDASGFHQIFVCYG